MPQIRRKMKGEEPRRRAQQEGDAISLLKADHRQVEKLFDQFKSIKSGKAVVRKQELVTAACAALKVHTMLEEELFYPALRRAFDETDLIDEAEVEHASVKVLIGELEFMTPADRLFDATFAVLTEYVKHHVKEEEGEIFPKAKKMVDMEALGTRMAIRKKELQANNTKGDLGRN